MCAYLLSICYISCLYAHVCCHTTWHICCLLCVTADVWQEIWRCDRRYGLFHVTADMESYTMCDRSLTPCVTGDMDSFMWQQIWSLTPCVTGVLHHMWQEIWTLSRLHIQDASALTRSPPFDAPQRHFLSDHAVRCLSATLCEYKIKHTQFTKWIYIYICIYIHIYVYIYYIYIR